MENRFVQLMFSGLMDKRLVNGLNIVYFIQLRYFWMVSENWDRFWTIIQKLFKNLGLIKNIV